MTDQQVLEKCIEIAIENEWNCFNADLSKWDWNLGEGLAYPLHMYFTPNESVGLITYTSQNYDANLIIFNHDFARALFGEDYHRDNTSLDGGTVMTRIQVAWQHHLQQLVLAEDRIDYLRKYLTDKD